MGLQSSTLEALAEATWQLGDLSLAANILCASGRLRKETGLAPAACLRAAVSAGRPSGAGCTTAEQLDLDAMVATLIAIPSRAAAVTT